MKIPFASSAFILKRDAQKAQMDWFIALFHAASREARTPIELNHIENSGACIFDAPGTDENAQPSSCSLETISMPKPDNPL